MHLLHNVRSVSIGLGLRCGNGVNVNETFEFSSNVLRLSNDILKILHRAKPYLTWRANFAAVPIFQTRGEQPHQSTTFLRLAQRQPWALFQLVMRKWLLLIVSQYLELNASWVRGEYRITSRLQCGRSSQLEEWWKRRVSSFWSGALRLKWNIRQSLGGEQANLSLRQAVYA